MGSKNKEWADAFNAFCMEHPELRFAQALLAWWKRDIDPEVGFIYTAPMLDQLDFTDTFYLESTPIEREDC